RTSAHVLPWDETPVPAVLRVVPVVAHHEVMVGRHDDWTPVVVGRFRWCCAKARRRERVSLLPAEMLRVGIVRLCWYLARRIHCGRRPVRLDTVHVQHRVTHVECIAAGSYETLDERRRGIVAV